MGASVLHVYFGHVGVHLLPLLKMAPVPAVVSFHGADAQLETQGAAYASAARQVLARAKLVLARSESLLRELEAFGCNPRKLRLHRTGLPLHEFPYQERRPARWGVAFACKPAASSRRKACRAPCAPLPAFCTHHPQSTLTIAGEGVLRASLGGMARELRLGDRVRFSGFLSQPDLRALFASAHVFLHPSETSAAGDQEGVPNSLLEAMASGLPVVASQHGGIPEAVEDGRSGLLVRERDHAALLQAMLRLASEPDLARSLGAAASRQVRAEFDLRVQTRVLEGLYAEAMHARLA